MKQPGAGRQHSTQTAVWRDHSQLVGGRVEGRALARAATAPTSAGWHRGMYVCKGKYSQRVTGILTL